MVVVGLRHMCLMGLWLLLLMVGSPTLSSIVPSSSTPEFDLSFSENIIRSLETNIFGSCSWSLATEDSTVRRQHKSKHTAGEAAFMLSPLFPSAEERRSFASLPRTMTKVNKDLGLGIVNGVPRADAWVRGKGNAWQLAPDHPRNNKTNCVNVTIKAGISAVDLYSNQRSNTSMYLLRAQHALLHETGVVGVECGYYQATESCETIFKFIGRKWWQKCTATLAARNVTWQHLFVLNSTSADSIDSNVGIDSAPSRHNGRGDEYDLSEKVYDLAALCGSNTSVIPRKYKRVLVVTAMWDHNYHHFLVDCLARLIRSLSLLHAHPDIRIHIREWEQFSKSERYIIGGRQLRHRLLSLLGLDVARFISGPVLAEEVFFARATKCNSPLRHALELRLLSNYLLRQAGVDRWRNGRESITLSHREVPLSATVGAAQAIGNAPLLSVPPPESPSSLVVLQRAAVLGGKNTWREWDDDVSQAVGAAFQSAFADLHLVTASSNNSTWSECLACQIREYSHTAVLVGAHGAGLTNMMFMPPGSLVVEIVGQYDGRMLPLCGYHGSLAAAFGVHHYIHYYDWKGGQKLDAQLIAHEASEFYASLSRNWR